MCRFLLRLLLGTVVAYDSFSSPRRRTISMAMSSVRWRRVLLGHAALLGLKDTIFRWHLGSPKLDLPINFSNSKQIRTSSESDAGDGEGDCCTRTGTNDASLPRMCRVSGGFLCVSSLSHHQLSMRAQIGGRGICRHSPPYMRTRKVVCTTHQKSSLVLVTIRHRTKRCPEWEVRKKASSWLRTCI